MRTDERVRSLFRETPPVDPVPTLDLSDVIGRVRTHRARRRLSRIFVGGLLAAGVAAPLLVLAGLGGDRLGPGRDPHIGSSPVPTPPSLDFTLTYVPKGLTQLADTTAVSPADALEEVPGGAAGLVVHGTKYGVPAAGDDILGNIPRGSPQLDVWVSRAPFDLAAELRKNERARRIVLRGLPAVLIPLPSSEVRWAVKWTEEGVLVEVLAINLPVDRVLAVAEGLRLGS